MKMWHVLFILTLFCLSFSVQMTTPIYKNINNGGSIFLGTIGPGQTLNVEFNPWINDEKGEYKGHYDLAKAVSLPEEWSSTTSKLYGDPLQITITSSKFEKEGIYNITILIIDEDNAEGLDNISINGKVEIKHNIMEMTINPEKMETGANQPAKYFITISNLGEASDVFEVSSENIPKWPFKKYIYVSKMSSKTISYEIAEEEEETFKPTIIVRSLSSNIIESRKNISLVVHSNLMNDYKATNYGTPLFPILEEPVFALMGLISNLW